MAKKNNSTDIEFTTDSIFSITKTYDLVILSHILEHIDGWVDFIEKIKECADRYIYINVPLEANLMNVIRGRALLGTYQKYGHLHFFDEAFLLQYLEDSGLTVVAKDYGEEFKCGKKNISTLAIRYMRIAAGLFSKRLCARYLGGYSLCLLLKKNNS